MKRFLKELIKERWIESYINQEGKIEYNSSEAQHLEVNYNIFLKGANDIYQDRKLKRFIKESKN